MKNIQIIRCNYNEDEIRPNQSDLYKYIGGKNDNSEVQKLFDACLKESIKLIYPRACYIVLPIKIEGNYIDFTYFGIDSVSLAKNLSGCSKCAVMGATLGTAFDRLETKYSVSSPIKACAVRNIGTEYIEKYCDLLCKDIENTFNCFTKMRFSPGYADLALNEQDKIFEILNLSKTCGIFLNENYSMSPQKSVTAFCGLSEHQCHDFGKCALCNKIDCQFRNI